MIPIRRSLTAFVLAGASALCPHSTAAAVAAPPPASPVVEISAIAPAVVSGPEILVGGLDAKVKAATLNVRSNPWVGAPIVTSATNGEIIKVYCATSRFGDLWYMTRSGYASASYLHTYGKTVQSCSLATITPDINEPFQIHPGDAAPSHQGIRARPAGPSEGFSQDRAPKATLAPYVDIMDREGSFRVQYGWARGSELSLESYFYPGYFLRHQDFAVRLTCPFKLTAAQLDLFRLDSSFTLRTYVINGVVQYRKFESFNYPLRYLRRYQGYIYVTDESTFADPRDRADEEQRWSF